MTVNRGLLLAPDALLQSGVTGRLELREFVTPEGQNIRLVCGLAVCGDAGEHDDMIAVCDVVLRLSPEGLARERHEEACDLVPAPVRAADGAVAWHDPLNVVGHVLHGTLEVSGAEGLVCGLGHRLRRGQYRLTNIQAGGPGRLAAPATWQSGRRAFLGGVTRSGQLLVPLTDPSAAAARTAAFCGLRDPDSACASTVCGYLPVVRLAHVRPDATRGLT